jgi:uncharacterized protein YecE (DUF72 family)
MGDLKTKYGAGGKRVFRYKELLWPREAAIEDWAARLRKHVDEARAIYILCSNHYEGFAPATCCRLGARLGLEIALPPTAASEPRGKGARQMKLL